MYNILYNSISIKFILLLYNITIINYNIQISCNDN